MLPVENTEATVKLLLPNGNDTLADVAAQAEANNLHLIYCGSTVLLSSIVPAGWRRLAISERTTHAEEKSPFLAYSPVSGNVIALPPINVAESN